MKERKNSRLIKERKNKKGRLLCLVPTCNNLREKYKTSDRTRNYCKKHTFNDMWEFTSWTGLKAKAFKRDGKKCVKCSDDREEVEVIVKHKKWIDLYESLAKGEKPKFELVEMKMVRNNFIGDHIKPIALGGKEFDLKNIQTLCLKCNKIKTKQDQKDIAKQRRIEKKK